MFKKMIDVNALVASLRRAGMDAGIGPEGGSSYPLVKLAGGMELYGFIPDPNFQGPSAEELVAQNLLDKLEENQAEMASYPEGGNGMPTYLDIAMDFNLWAAYVDRYADEEEFNAMSTEQKIALLLQCFGPEVQEVDAEDQDL